MERGVCYFTWFKTTTTAAFLSFSIGEKKDKYLIDFTFKLVSGGYYIHREVGRECVKSGVSWYSQNIRKRNKIFYILVFVLLLKIHSVWLLLFAINLVYMHIDCFSFQGVLLLDLPVIHRETPTCYKTLMPKKYTSPYKWFLSW